MGLLSVYVKGKPITQGSMRVGLTSTGKPYMYHVKDAKLMAWRNDIARSLQAVSSFPGKLDEPIAVRCRFLIPHPRSNRDRYPMKQKGDLDKYIRAVLDAMTGIIIDDDAQVVRINATKEWAPDDMPGNTIRAIHSGLSLAVYWGDALKNDGR